MILTSRKFLKTKILISIYCVLLIASTIHIELGSEYAATYDEAGNKTGERIVPTTMEQAMEELDNMLSEEKKKEFMEVYKSDPVEFHFGLGMGLRNSWGLWAGSELARRLSWAGITHPDMMSGYIIEEYASHLNGTGSSDLILRRGIVLLVLSVFITLGLALIDWVVRMVVRVVRRFGIQPVAGGDATR